MKKAIFLQGLIYSVLCLPSLNTFAADQAASDSAGESFWTRKQLTGNWGGLRDDLADHGVTFDLNATHITQHLISGGLQSPVFDRNQPDVHETESHGLFNMLLTIDTGKAGLWPGGFLKVRGESRVGQGLGLKAGGVMPTSGDSLSPTVPGHAYDETLVLSELNYAQFLSEQFGVAVGLLNTMEGDSNPIAGSLRSRTHFMNPSMRFSPVVLGSMPVAALGAVAIVIPNEHFIGQIGFMNTEESSGYDPFEYDAGSTFFTEWKYKDQIGNLPTEHTIGFLYSYDRNSLDISRDPRLQIKDVITTGSTSETNADGWAVYYNGAQYLQGDAENGWGIFLRLGLSDGHPSPVKWHTAFGLGGQGLGSFRPQDNWGIGGFAYGFSDEPLLNNLGLDDEVGFEAFYNIGVTPWADVTLDLQYVDSPLNGFTGMLNNTRLEAQDSWVFNLRTHWTF